MKAFLNIHPEVTKAVQTGMPIVALESTIIAHGMPYPENLETAKKLESIIRAEGAIPATIAVLHGKICVGLGQQELELLATQSDMPKASRRDLPLLLAQKQHGATTVAATMIGASLAGIHIFATGGVGGVHRGASQTMDISADLQELAQTPVAVVSAGVKSILDIPLTLEYLETHGVPVICYQTDEFPAFYTRKSGSKSPSRLDSPQEIAAVIQAQRQLGYPGGMLIANPIPASYSMNKEQISLIIDQAIEEADRLQIHGKELTPFLLNKIKLLTEGDSLFSNIQLVYNNARLAAQIASAM
ncbi:MAG: pseudouridine-5'-phosphate glycosidase [Bacteroidota bacterium]